MENPLLKKLHFKPGFRILLANSPENPTGILGDTGSMTLSTDSSAVYDGLLIFVKNSIELGNALEIWGPRINNRQITWIAYPKKTSGITTDLKMEKWEALGIYRLTPCGSAAIDDTWTGLRIKPVDDVKKSGAGNAQIKTSAYGEYIDVERKTVSPPADLLALFHTHPEAAAQFNSLAYSHKKEYVLWILTAKQEQTRKSRLDKMIEMLLTGKKNPTMK